MTALHVGVVDFLTHNGELELTEDGETLASLGLETLVMDVANTAQVFVLLTYTNSLMSNVTKLVLDHPYTHASMSFNPELEPLYSYNISPFINQGSGGMVTETLEDLKGSLYSLYAINVTKDIHQRMQDRVNEYLAQKSKTAYNQAGLFNLLMQKNVFQSENLLKMFCSQFIVEMFNHVGIELFKNKHSSLIRPYDFVKTKLLKFVRRGKIK